MATIICEIPHRFPPMAWLAENDDFIVSIAESEHDLIYQRWTLDAAIECFGADDIPEELTNLLKVHDEAVQVGDSNDSFLYSPDDAPTELEAAMELIAHDLQDCHFLTVEEAREFAELHKGHQCYAARAEVKKLLEEIIDA